MSNPYNAPTADLSQRIDTSGETYVPQMIAINGRIGRLRYLAYSFLLSVLMLLAFGLVAGLLSLISPMLAMLSMILLVPAIAVGFIMAKRRFNDMNRSGWWSLLTFVPFVGFLVSLWLIFGPGDDSANDFGLPPAPNTTGIVVAAVCVPLFVVFIGIAAAIAVPAYQSYVERAKAAQAAAETPAPAEQLEAAPQ